MGLRPLLFNVGIAAALLLVTQLVHSHGRWILPSHTQLSGDKSQVITLDMSISNELFQGDYGFLYSVPKGHKGPPPASLNMLTPNGKVVNKLPFEYFTRKSVGQAKLEQNGTYLFNLLQEPLYFVTYTDTKGKFGRAFGKRAQVKLPANAQNISAVQMISNITSYVSRNGQTTPPLIEQGLSLGKGTHPNDLFVGEKAQLQLLFNGKPVKAGVNVQLIPGGTRYRNDREVHQLTTDDKGMIEFAWNKAGIWLLEAEQEKPGKAPDIDTEIYALYTTLEVNPE